MAGLADGLQIVVFICAAFGLGHDVINCSRWSILALLEARLAEASIAAQYSLAGLIPLSAITTLMAAASSRISELAQVPIALVCSAVAAAITHQLAAARVPAGAWCGYWHGNEKACDLTIRRP